MKKRLLRCPNTSLDAGALYPKPLRKRDKLGVPRSPIRSNIILRKLLPSVYILLASVKAHSLVLHNLLHLPLRLLVQPRAGVPGCHIGLEIEIARRKTPTLYHSRMTKEGACRYSRGWGATICYGSIGCGLGRELTGVYVSR